VHDFFQNFLKNFKKQNLLPKNPGANAPGSQDEFPPDNKKESNEGE
jgi:hypothetical protein